MMELNLSVHGNVDDEAEALAIREAVDVALIPFAELDLKIESRCTVEIPPEPTPP